MDRRKQGKCDYLLNMDRNFTSHKEFPELSFSTCDESMTGAAEHITAYNGAYEEKTESKVNTYVEYEGTDLDAEFISLEQEILVNPLTSEGHIMGVRHQEFLEISAARDTTFEVEMEDSSGSEEKLFSPQNSNSSLL